MKKLLFIATLFFVPVAFGQNKVKVSPKIHNLLESLKDQPSNVDRRLYSKQISKFDAVIEQPDAFLFTWCSLRLSDYNNFEATLAEKRGKPTLKAYRADVEKFIFDYWEKRLTEEQRIFIEEEYPHVMQSARYWYNTITEKIENIPKDLDYDFTQPGSFPDTVVDASDVRNSRIEEYQSHERLVNIADDFSGFMDSVIETKPDGDQLTYRLIFERSGAGGADLIITVQPNYEKTLKFYKKGQFTTPESDIVLESFAISAKNQIDPTLVLVAKVEGIADAYAISQNSGVTYTRKSHLWGSIHEQAKIRGKNQAGDVVIQDIDSVHLEPYQNLTNEELAFMRAYNAKMIFEKVFPGQKVSAIVVTDYLALDSSKKDAIGTYRNAIIRIHVFGYFTQDYRDLDNVKYVGYDAEFHDEVIRDKTLK